MELKAQIARPSVGEVIPAVGAPYRIYGAAWGGTDEIAEVELSTDGGVTWSSANLVRESVKDAWRFWEFFWKPPQPGKYVLIARARDSAGRTQPELRNPDYGTYVVNHWLPIEVEIR